MERPCLSVVVAGPDTREHGHTADTQNADLLLPNGLGIPDSLDQAVSVQPHTARLAGPSGMWARAAVRNLLASSKAAGNRRRDARFCNPELTWPEASAPALPLVASARRRFAWSVPRAGRSAGRERG
jgi:hypothetical protein